MKFGLEEELIMWIMKTAITQIWMVCHLLPFAKVGQNCNSLLYGLPVSLLSKMQSIQNSAARIVSRKRLHDHISPILNELHWLPVEKRITFKLLILAYKCNQGVAPQYLLDIVKSYQPARNLRSSSIFLHRTLLLQKDMGKGLFSMQFLSCGTHYQITYVSLLSNSKLN